MMGIFDELTCIIYSALDVGDGIQDKISTMRVI